MDFTHGYASANDLKVFYHRGGSGNGKVPLLLLHGYTDNGLCWSRVADDLVGTYDVMMPDARGHGRTQGPVHDLSYEQLGQDAQAFIEAMGLERPFLFGHSMGALTALIVAANAPELVRGIVLEDPPFFSEQSPDGLNMKFMQKAAADGRAFQKRPLSERMAVCRTNDPGWAEEEVLPWAESKGEYNPDILAPDVRVRMHQFSWRKAAAQVKCPALLVTAERGIVTPEIAAEAVSLIADCQLVQIPAAGHCIHRDAYAETMQFVTSFLAQ
jgi:pimeloyl-ACP methyl ester carboxylesterase